MQGDSVSLPLEIADDIAWHYHDLAKSRTVERPPARGEVCVWLVTSEFRFASASNIGSWLSVAERRRARLHPNSSIGRRFGVARATLRLVVSQMFRCRPQEVRVEDGPDERIVVTDPQGGGGLFVDVAYSGIWIVIAVASANVGIGLAANSPGDAAHIGRMRAERGDIVNKCDGAASAAWHGVVLPMPGELAGVVAVDAPVSDVQAFGWEKPVEEGARASLR
ncbi:hypothetical protein [Caballeronia sp. Lep1P3]|uniref:hypothetical protein n=1 Tax=Caballeronia sp. Lep1P3 TaxID=2878150 RepID=UPI001FD5F106|nr:hypothetical protein [Caballeronia sp. Lep1P3]